MLDTRVFHRHGKWDGAVGWRHRAGWRATHEEFPNLEKLNKHSNTKAGKEGGSMLARVLGGSFKVCAGLSLGNSLGEFLGPVALRAFR